LSGVDPIIEFKDIGKFFPAVKALDGVSFRIGQGTIHAIVGENGAGKSTLMNILGGQYLPDAGTVLHKGVPVTLQSELEAHRLGIAVVYQELRLCPNLTVTENLFLGRERALGEGRVDWPAMRQRAMAILSGLGSDLSPDAIVGDLSIAKQQLVEIARALSLDAEVLILDEPTSALSLKETQELIRNLEALRARGVTILYISHRLEEVFALADQITVLRDGQYIGTFDRDQIDPDGIVRLIAGNDLVHLLAAPSAVPDLSGKPKVLEVRNLSRPGCFREVSFDLYEGEILGLYGLQGAGRTEVLETLFGLAPAWSGEVRAFGQPMRNRSPREAIRNGLAMIPENRRDSGIFPDLDITDNISTANPGDMSNRIGLLRRGFMARLAENSIQALKIKTSSRTKKAVDLSGGNQQKVIIAKWLASHPRIVLVDELTRGIDVGAKYEIYKILKELRDSGLSILMVSSELAEILAESDRILVMKDGALVANLAGAERTRDQVIHYAL